MFAAHLSRGFVAVAFNEPAALYSSLNSSSACRSSSTVSKERRFRAEVAAGKYVEEPQKGRMLTAEEKEKILQAIKNADIRYCHRADIIAAVLNTGMRGNEIPSTEKCLILLAKSVIVVPGSSRKRKKKDKRVPINCASKPIVERLMQQNSKCPYSFVNPKTGTRFTSIHNAWNGILRKPGLRGKPGVDKLRIHDLRDTAATNLGRRGKELRFWLRSHQNPQQWY